jgi:hypothetical protein
MLHTDDPRAFIDECLALCHNYVKTGQSIKVMQVLGVLKKVDPDNPLVHSFTSGVDFSGGGASVSFEVSKEAVGFFGEDWRGESLEGKSIEVFADQGAGDIIMLLRYLREMKRRWECRISLNCYAHYSLLHGLLSDLDCLDRLTNKHIICDYQVNLYSVPALLNGLDVYYPANFAELLEMPIPEQPVLRGVLAAPSSKKKVGVAWESNPNNLLYEKKSLDPELLRPLQGDVELISILPGKFGLDFIDERRTLESLKDTARIISTLDAVISVDTATLHLAGTMGKTTFGLLAYDADARWGKEDETPWYPSVKLFRQVTENSWEEPLEELAKALEEV